MPSSRQYNIRRACTPLKKVDTYRVSQLYYVDSFPKDDNVNNKVILLNLH